MGISDRIRELADKEGISFNALEKKIGLGKSVIYRWNEKIPAIDKVKLVADYFGVTVDYLISDEPKPEKENTEDAQLRAEIMKSIDGMSEVDLKTVLAMSKVIAERQKEKEKDEK